MTATELPKDDGPPISGGLTVDTTNAQLVALRGGEVIVIMPTGGPLSAAQARSFAAWLVVIADTAEMVSGQPAPSFEAYLAAVRNT
jgi:hypothetical protein